MSDPRRLREEGGLASSLLRAGAEELPSHDAVRRAALAIGAGVAVASTSVAASAAGLATGTAGSVMSKAGAPFTFVFVAKWLGIGTLTGLVTVTSASQLDRLRSHGLAVHAPVPTVTVSPPATSVVRSTPVAPPATELPAPVEIEPRPPTSSSPIAAPAHLEPLREKVDRTAPALRTETPALPAAPAETLAPVPPTRAPSDEAPRGLAPEMAFVDRAWQDVQRGSAERALVELAAYEVRFPSLRLHPEVLFLRMRAETQLGHASNAVSLARQIVSAYPKSAQATRARSLLNGQ